jgi:DNA polymerase III epsilon subunit-like protein
MGVKHVMVDLETLGTLPGCRILSIGAVFFSQDGLGQEFYREAQINYQGDLVVEEATLGWWQSRPAEVRDRLFEGQNDKPVLRTVLEQFNAWLDSYADRDVIDQKIGHLRLGLWGNGADFDNAILQVAFDRVCESGPAWPFWSNRCYRTLKNLAPSIKMVRQGNHHNALDDAKSQALHAAELLNYLNAW